MTVTAHRPMTVEGAALCTEPTPPIGMADCLMQPEFAAPDPTYADTFEHWKGVPGDGPLVAEMLQLAWETHAAGYLRAGLAKPAAIRDGLLDETIDRSRRLRRGITYYLTINPDDIDDRSTARLIDARSVEELPTYPLTKDGIHPDALKRLKFAVEVEGKQLCELGAFADSKPGRTPGTEELLRDILTDTVGRNQLLFCSMAAPVQKYLSRILSPANFEPIGDPVVLEENELRGETVLIPVVIDPDKFIDNLLAAYYEAKDPATKVMYREKALFYSAKLPPEHTPSGIIVLREEARIEKLAQLPRLLGEMPEQDQTWQPPEIFDLSDPDGRRRLQEAIVSGRVLIHDPFSDQTAPALYDYQHPTEKGQRSPQRNAFYERIAALGETVGVWVLDPVTGRLSHFPSKQALYALRTSRNRYLITESEQEQLRKAKVMVVGLSVGSRALESLVDLGIGIKYVADSDSIDPTNINRLRVGYTSVGAHKVDEALRYISSKDPWANVVAFRNGLRSEDLDNINPAELPDIIVEEVDDMAIKALIREFAQKHGIAVVSSADVGDNSLNMVERYDLPTDKNAKPFLGRIRGADYERLLSAARDGSSLSGDENRKFMLKQIGVGYLIKTRQARLLDSALEMIQGQRLGGLPQLGTTATRGGANVGLLVREILLGRGPKSGRYDDDPRRTLGLPREATRFETLKIAFRLAWRMRSAARSGSRES